MKQLDLAPIRPGISYVRISYHNVRNEYLYEVIEPPLSPIEKELTDRLHTVLIDDFEPLPENDTETKRSELRRMVDDQLLEWELAPGPVTKARILYYLERDFIGYGVVEVPMTDTRGGGHLVRRGGHPALHLPPQVRFDPLEPEVRQLEGRSTTTSSGSPSARASTSPSRARSSTRPSPTAPVCRRRSGCT